MEKNVYIIDYIGNSDNTGKPIGHPVKIINEFCRIIDKKINLKVIVPNCYKEYMNSNTSEKIFLKYNQNMTDISLKNKLFSLIGRLINIKRSFRYSSGILWFVNVDFSLFLYLFLNGKKGNSKIWATLYTDEYNHSTTLKSKIKNFFYLKAINKIDKQIYTNKKLSNVNVNSVYIPDFYYQENVYGKYKNIAKKDQVLCTGTMSECKDLESLVKVFNLMDMPLIIAGKFYDKARFKKLSEICNPNIKIIDKTLDYDEYYTLISESKYTIFPYKKDFYERRTSGVLLESIFLKSIPIAPEYLLEFNGVPGLHYDDIFEIKNIFDKNINFKEIESKMTDVSREYDILNIKNKVAELIRNN